MKPTRDRLRIADEKHSHMVSHVSDAELRAMGYVKLSMDALVPLFRQGGFSGAYYPDDSGDPDGYFIPAQVLAALDGEQRTDDDAWACPHGVPWVHAHCCPPERSE